MNREKELLLTRLACPRCQDSLLIGDELVCSNCGRRYVLEGDIASFLGSRADLAADEKIAKRLLDDFEAVRTAIAAAQGGSPNQRREGLNELSRLLGVPNDIAYKKLLDETLPLAQVLNDLNYFGDPSQSKAVSVTHQFMSDNVGNSDGVAILDVGCSVGRHLRRLVPGSSILAGMDFSALSLCLAAQAWSKNYVGQVPLFCCASVTEIPFSAESFDQVMSFVVLGLVPMRKALSEIWRVLKPEGELIFTIEGLGFWQKLWDEAPFFSRRRLGLARRWLGRQLLTINWQSRRLSTVLEYSPGTLKRFLTQQGFKISKIEVLSRYKNKPLTLGVVAHK